MQGRRRMSPLWLAAALVIAACGAAAQDVDVELGLGMDDSGSINNAEWLLQFNAYLEVLNDTAVVPRDGTVGIGLWAFSATVVEIHPVIKISSQSDIDSLLNALNNYSRASGATAVGRCIQTISDALTTNNITSNKQVIDISTDGTTNTGPASNTEADAAIVKGIEQLNCLAIEKTTNQLCGWIRGNGSFAQQATSFSDFKQALQDKLIREIQTCSNGGKLICNPGCTCDCPPQYTGQVCETCILGCSNGGTVNNQTCTCNCPGAWSGINCTTCTRTCQNGGTLNPSTCTCSCPTPWSGDNCQTCSRSCNGKGTLNATSCTCDCNYPYSGDSCTQCSRNCQNGGTLNPGPCTCNCLPAFAGTPDCDNCTLQCQNGGILQPTCSCHCPSQYNGTTCTNCIRTCVNGGSLNGATCNCSCPTPYTGDRCETCSRTCQNGGILNPSTCTCTCPYPYSGPNCETCSIQCQNSGVKDTSNGQCKCNCAGSWAGINCTDCERECLNGLVVRSSCTCNCNNPWTGANCTICNNTCQNGGSLNAAECACDCVYPYSGLSCQSCTPICGNGGFAETSPSCGCQCPYPWSGPQCTVCSRTCANGGTLFNDGCTCHCVSPWGGANCTQCSQTCVNGALNTAACNCSCTAPWTGARCDQCDITCENGGEVDPSTCTCKCSIPWGGARCAEKCDTVWTQWEYEREPWQHVALTPRMDALADSTLTAADLAMAFGGNRSRFLLTKDRANMYISGGDFELHMPFLNVLRRASNNDLTLLQRITGPSLGAPLMTFGRSVDSPDGRNVYTIVFNYSSPSATPTAHVAVFRRVVGGKLRLEHLETLTNAITTQQRASGGETDVHITVSPDGYNVYVALQTSLNLRPQLFVYRRVQFIKPSTMSCTPVTERVEPPPAFGYLSTDLGQAIPVCPGTQVCYQGVCADLDTNGTLQLQQTTSSIDGYQVTNLLVSSDSRFVYAAVSGYAPVAVRSGFGTGLRPDTLTVYERKNSFSLEVRQTLTLRAAQVDWTSLTVLLSPSELYFYVFQARADQENANRTIRSYTRSMLDGRVSVAALELNQLGHCHNNPNWHPAVQCSSSRFVWLQNKLAARAPATASVPLAPQYTWRNTSMEVFLWANESSMCPHNALSASSLARFVFELTEDEGLFDAYAIACDDDFAYVNANGGIRLFHIAPRELLFHVDDPVSDIVWRRFDPIVPLTPKNKGGSVETYTIAPSLPPGVAINPITGVISGTPTALTNKTTYLVRATSRSGAAAVSALTIEVHNGIAPFCSDVDLSVSEPTSSLAKNAWMWLFWGLLLCCLPFCCFIYRREKKKKEQAGFEDPPPEVVTTKDTHEFLEPEDVVKLPAADPLSALAAHNKKTPMQLRLRPLHENDMFQFGTRRIQLSIINDKLMVRVGGGWSDVEEFVNKNAPIEARKLGLDASELELKRAMANDLRQADSIIRKKHGGTLKRSKSKGSKKNLKSSSSRKGLLSSSSSSSELDTTEVALELPRMSAARGPGDSRPMGRASSRPGLSSIDER